MADRALLLVTIVACAGIVGALVNVAIKRRHHLESIDPTYFDAGAKVVVFSSPYCHGCKQWLEELEQSSVPAAAIDISERPDAAAVYRINSTPRVAVVEPNGRVVKEFHHYAPRQHDLDQIIRLTKTS